ncbi:transcriptional regulator with XRE-family HTH domain [Kitasatospora sp. MAA4]|uniref:helix-turn-helix domain-containing protein n=1 Tax=Kitasatospora sp. MAA4 TaxID=3035093 RepID=UPI0024753ED9|nr:helix-turn-helix transcriptional regulator [Kitasatospora sp. MAA4]MDH6137127.1 transcriptional regulator with XRE-family HTH domain [Kitasatospora sp. MAA4]
MTGTTAALGPRIATLRNARGLTQVELATKALVSPSMIRKVEQGRRAPGDDVLQAIAQALHTTADHLLEGPGHTDSRVHAAIPAIRSVIATYDLPDDVPVRPLSQLGTAVQVVVGQRLHSDYARLAAGIAPLLAELQCAVQLYQGADRQQAARLLTAAYRAADAAAYKHGHTDLSGRLVELIRWAAGIAEDPALTAVAAYVRTEVFFASGILPVGLRALQQAIDTAPAPATEQLQATVGALHMRAAVVAGRMRDPDTAHTHLTEAAALTAGIRERVYHGTAAGPDSLQIHRLAVAVELGNAPGLNSAIRAASSWQPPHNLPSERRSHYYIDLARAQMQLGRRDHAQESLQLARRIAPQHVREHGQVRAELATLVRLDRTRDEQLLAFARWARAI